MIPVVRSTSIHGHGQGVSPRRTRPMLEGLRAHNTVISLISLHKRLTMVSEDDLMWQCSPSVHSLLLGQVMISGPDDTPYSGGLFSFDIFFPFNYPISPPKVRLVTTGGSVHRFNPNLYAGENRRTARSLVLSGRPHSEMLLREWSRCRGAVDTAALA